MIDSNSNSNSTLVSSSDGDEDPDIDFFPQNLLVSNNNIDNKKHTRHGLVLDNDSSDTDNNNIAEIDMDDINELEIGLQLMNSSNRGCLDSQFCHQIAEYDSHYSQKIYNLKLGLIFDILLLIPSFLFGFWGVLITNFVIFFLCQSFIYSLIWCITVVATLILKRFIQRSRPNNNGSTYKLNYQNIKEKSPKTMTVCEWIDKRLRKKSKSFPSGDTAQAAVFACYMSFYQNLTFWWMLFIPWTGFARIYLGKHYIGDVIGGSSLGIIVCVLAYLIFQHYDMFSFFRIDIFSHK